MTTPSQKTWTTAEIKTILAQAGRTNTTALTYTREHAHTLEEIRAYLQGVTDTLEMLTSTFVGASHG